MLADFREERTRIEEAILVLERIAVGRGKVKHRGRPPKWMDGIKRRGPGRPPGSRNKPKGE